MAETTPVQPSDATRMPLDEAQKEANVASELASSMAKGEPGAAHYTAVDNYLTNFQKENPRVHEARMTYTNLIIELKNALGGQENLQKVLDECMVEARNFQQSLERNLSGRMSIPDTALLGYAIDTLKVKLKLTTEVQGNLFGFYQAKKEWEAYVASVQK